MLKIALIKWDTGVKKIPVATASRRCPPAAAVINANEAVLNTIGGKKENMHVVSSINCHPCSTTREERKSRSCKLNWGVIVTTVRTYAHKFV